MDTYEFGYGKLFDGLRALYDNKDNDLVDPLIDLFNLKQNKTNKPKQKTKLDNNLPSSLFCSF